MTKGPQALAPHLTSLSFQTPTQIAQTAASQQRCDQIVQNFTRSKSKHTRIILIDFMPMREVVVDHVAIKGMGRLTLSIRYIIIPMPSAYVLQRAGKVESVEDEGGMYGAFPFCRLTLFMTSEFSAIRGLEVGVMNRSFHSMVGGQHIVIAWNTLRDWHMWCLA